MKKKLMSIMVVAMMVMMTACGKKDVDVNSNSNTDNSNTESVSKDSDSESKDVSVENGDTRKHYDALPEIVNAKLGDNMIQVADMIFYYGERMTVDDVKATIDASDCGWTYEDYEYTDEDSGEIRPCIAIIDENGTCITCGRPSSDMIMRFIWNYDEQQYYLSDIVRKGEYLPCNEDSVYIAGGIPVNTYKANFTEVTLDSLIADLQAVGGYEINNDLYLNYSGFASMENHPEEFPPCIYTVLNSKDQLDLLILDNNRNGMEDKYGEKCIVCINYTFYFDKNTGILRSVAFSDYTESITQSEFERVCERHNNQ